MSASQEGPKPEGVIRVLQVVTFGVQLGSVLGEALEANLLPQQVQELFEGGTGCLVVVHFLFGALARSAVHHPDLHLKTQLGSDKGGERKKPTRFPMKGAKRRAGDLRNTTSPK